MAVSGNQRVLDVDFYNNATESLTKGEYHEVVAKINGLSDVVEGMHLSIRNFKKKKIPDPSDIKTLSKNSTAFKP